MDNENNKLPSSFRDPSGFLFIEDGKLYRQINQCYASNYKKLLVSGLYKVLTKKKYLINHSEVDQESVINKGVFKIIKPEFVPFISYPYEWCFSELKDVALLTLEIQKIAIAHDLSLKDASAYNIQFYKGKPILIDTLSFEKYEENRPWVAYKQFCQHFLAPLALMRYKDIRLNQLLKIYIDGIPLSLASELLPKRTYLRFPLLTHIHLHAKSQEKYSDKTIDINSKKISKFQLLALIDNLKSFIKNLNLPRIKTEWRDYYDNTNYTKVAREDKKRIIEKFVLEIKPRSVWDLGANTGFFSRITSRKDINTISFDIDPSAVEMNYSEMKKNNEQSILPLVMDLTNPSPSIGWGNAERNSLTERGPVDLVMALALVHHLAISNNTPLERIAKFFSKLGKYLIIEWIPKEDSNTQRLLRTRGDIFKKYNQEEFEKEFAKFFDIKEKIRIETSERSLYLMEKI